MPRSFDPRKAGENDPFAPPTPGKYAVRISGIEKKQGPSDDYLNIEGTVLAGPLATHGPVVKSPYENRKLWDMLSYSPGAQARLGQAFIAVGHADPPRDLDDMGEMRNEVFLGRVVVFTIGHEEYQGTPKARVRKWESAPADVLAAFPHLPPNGPSPSARPVGAPAGAPAGVSAGSGPPLVDDLGDEIPF